MHERYLFDMNTMNLHFLPQTGTLLSHSPEVVQNNIELPATLYRSLHENDADVVVPFTDKATSPLAGASNAGHCTVEEKKFLVIMN
jgi:hypothetical protein